MSRLPVTAVFDIGKTNKKFFLFDENMQEVYQTYTRFEPVPDEDGFPAEALKDMSEWMLSTFQEALDFEDFEIRNLNFSTHGASLVHTDKDGEPVSPQYDYLKPFPEDLLEKFYSDNGGEEEFCSRTASPKLAMLNSGLQLYFLKYAKPEFFQKAGFSFHLPQYASFLFTGVMCSDFTSIGCHTGLWDFQNKDYHAWVDNENLRDFFPPIKSGQTVLKTKPELGGIPCGIGVHDSSAALLPYLKQEDEPFALLSTGTWAISINPFNSTTLTTEELKKDCLQFLSVTGNPIKISRLFIGEEHKYQIEEMYAHFKKTEGTYKKLEFEEYLYKEAVSNKTSRIHFHHILPENYGLNQATETNWGIFNIFEEAYYSFIDALTDVQIASLDLVLKGTEVRRIFVDGGFNANEIFIGFLKKKLPGFEIISSDFPNGSALGAALLINEAEKLNG